MINLSLSFRHPRIVMLDYGCIVTTLF